MNSYIQIPKMLFIFALAFAVSSTARAQGGGAGEGIHTWPDVLAIVEATGTISIDDSFAHPLYFLDTDGDNEADYHLSFGPWWYEPGDGVDRPEAGATVTISGTLQGPIASITLETIVVFELDGETWRVPVEYGRLGWNSEPFWFVSDDTMTVSGTVFIDTTYYYDHYYVDIDGDTLPEYQLGFGPIWYEPESGATRPAEGDEVTVFGIEHSRAGIDLLTVFELNGEVWRPLNEPAPWAGGWLTRERFDSTRAFCMNNPQSWVDFPPDNFGRGQGGPNWPDSMFVQFWEIHPDSLPGMAKDRIFSGYHIQVHDRDRTRMMDGRYGGENGLMRFELQHHVRLRYYDEDLEAAEISETSIMVWVWDNTSEEWGEFEGIQVDEVENIVTFETDDLVSYYALAGDLTGTAVQESSEVPRRIALLQNYPNPFNPQTTIPFVLSSPQHVRLEVFDLLGRKVATLVDEVRAAGEYDVAFDAMQLPSGVYVYQLKGASSTLRRELVVMK